MLSPIGLEEGEEVTRKSDEYDEVDKSGKLGKEKVRTDKKTKSEIVQRYSTFSKRKQPKKGQNNEGTWIILRQREMNETKQLAK